MRVTPKAISGLADQVVSGASNFLFVVLVARAATAEGFGAFSVGHAGIVLLLVLGRAVLGTPLLIAAADEGPRSRLGDALMMGLALGGGGALLVTVTASVAGNPMITAVLLGVSGLVAVLQDVCRHAASAAGRPGLALAIDALWLALVGAALVLDVGGAVASGVVVPVVVWLLGGAAGLVVATIVLRPVLEPRGLGERMRGTMRLRSHLAIALVTPQVAMLLVLSVLAVGLGTADVAALRGAGTLMGPVNLLFAAMTFVALPEIARRGRQVSTVRIATWLAAFLWLAVAAWAGALLLLPLSAGQALLGASWAGAHDVLPIAAVEAMFAAASIAAGTVMQATGAADRHARARLVYAAGVVFAGPVLAFVASDVRLVAGAFAGCAALAAAFSWTYLRAHEGSRALTLQR